MEANRADGQDNGETLGKKCIIDIVTIISCHHWTYHISIGQHLLRLFEFCAEKLFLVANLGVKSKRA